MLRVVIVVLSCFGGPWLAQAATSFQLSVPNKPIPMQITKLQIHVDVGITNPMDPVTFTVTDPEGNAFAFAPLTPGAAGADHTYPTADGGPTPDEVFITPPSGALLAGDPLKRRYRIVLDMNSNFIGGAPTFPEIWTISAGATTISAACVQSLDQRNGTGITTLIPSGELVATVVSNPNPTQNCLDARKHVDAVLVLDKSGSMASSTLGTAPQPKINAMRSAVQDFVAMWNAVRAGEPSPSPYDDKIGVVQFDSLASWWKPTGAFVDGLNPYPTVSASVTANVGSIVPGTMTALGSGVLLGDSALSFASADRRRLILLMSDGIQNWDKMIGLDASMPPKPATYAPVTPAMKTVLPNWNASTYPIYGVTVGTSTAISSQVFQDLTTATGGFYLNTEADAGLLRPFFMQIVQNFIKFSTWETVRLVSEKVTAAQPYTTKFPLASTSTRVSINVLWPNNLGTLRLSVTPPGESEPRVMRGEGAIYMNLDLPTSKTYTVKGEWLVKVEQEPFINLETHVSNPIANVAPAIPFDLVVMADDHGLNSDLDIEAKPYGAGDKIRLQASVQEFGRRIKTLGTKVGDKLLVQVVQPGVSIGDLLSSSSASSTGPTSPDSATPADIKLQNHLAKDPDSLVRNQNVMTLVDDGRPEHGDAVAGDGIYSALYPASMPGHYNFLFGIEGQTKGVGRLSRQQLRTVLVRSIPDGGTTPLQINVQQINGVQTYVINMTPKTKVGSRLGPGWANYFWFTAPGQQAVKPTDNMNGTYTVHMPFTGSTPPVVSWHFLGGASTVIVDSVTADQLPVPLNDKTVVVPDVANPPSRCRCFDLFCLIKTALPW